MDPYRDGTYLLHAREARALSISNAQRKMDRLFEDIKLAIHAACERGESQIYVQDRVPGPMRSVFAELGYKIENIWSNENGSTVRIYW